MRATSITPLQLFLNLIIVALCSIRRIWHLNDLTDSGLSLFTGRRSLLDQATCSRLLSAIKDCGFSRLKSLWVKSIVCSLKGRKPLIVSIDEHIVPYWGKLKIDKTKVATRGRVMKATSFFYCYASACLRIIDFDFTGAQMHLSQCLLKYIQYLRSLFGIRQKFIFLFDKGGYKAQNFQKLLQQRPVRFVTPAKNTSENKRQWDKISDDKYKDFVHPTKGELLKITITQTKLKGLVKPIRTILLKTKKGYHGFFTNFARLKAKALIKLYSSRWAQETSFRILKNDLCLDYLPRRKKPDQEMSQLNATPIGFVTWVKSFTFNLLREFGLCLGKRYEKMYAGTFLRKFIARPGKIAIYPDRLSVHLSPFREQDILRPYVNTLNKQKIPIPWMQNLRLEVVVNQEKYVHKKGNYLCP